MSANTTEKAGSRKREAIWITFCTLIIFLIFVSIGKHESEDKSNDGFLKSAKTFTEKLIRDLDAINPAALTNAFKERLLKCHFGWNVMCQEIYPSSEIIDFENRNLGFGRFYKPQMPLLCVRPLWDTFDHFLETLRGIPSAARFTVEEVFTKGWASVVVFGFSTLLVGAMAAGAIAEREFFRLIVIALLYASVIPSFIAFIVQRFLSLTLHIFSGLISLLVLVVAFAVPTVFIIEKLATAHHVAEFLMRVKKKLAGDEH